MNRTELYISNLYKNMNIYHPYQLMIDTVSKKLNLSVTFWGFTSEIAFYKGVYKVFINENQSNQQQWQYFGHEMYHYCHDYVVYDRLYETYVYYFVCKSVNFAINFFFPISS